LIALKETGKLVWAKEEQERKGAVISIEIRVQQMIELAQNRETAVRWIHQAEGTDGDNERLCYELNLPFGYFSIAR
jgi:hypothetical protein